MRLIGASGEQVGIIPIREALERAREANLDLVEVSPTSRPPVCRIMDFGKYKYELAKKAKLARKKQHVVQMKEMRYRPKIDEHDFQFKRRNAERFLLEGNKVKATVIFRGRERAHAEIGQQLLIRLAEELSETAVVESPPKSEGNVMIQVLGPKREVLARQKHRKPSPESGEPAETEVDLPAEDAGDHAEIDNGTEGA